MNPEPAGDDRRYSDREFKLILRRAFDLEERAPSPVRHTTGLSLAEMRSIAAEVGLYPTTLERAAALLPSEQWSGFSKLLGGPEAVAFNMELDGELHEDDYGPVVQVIRRVLKQRGDSRRTGKGLEWKNVGRSHQVHVAVTPRAGRTSVDVTADRAHSIVFSTFLPSLAWAVFATIVGAAAQPTGAVAIAALIGTGILGALLSARVVWRMATGRMRSAVERLAGGLYKEISQLNQHRAALPAPETTDPDV